MKIQDAANIGNEWNIGIFHTTLVKLSGDPPIGDWILIQRWKVEKSDAFKANGWMEYRNGFGEKNGNEYWMGLENMRKMLETGRWQLYIGLRALKYPTWSYIIYNDFKIGDEIRGDLKLVFSSSWELNQIFSRGHATLHLAVSVGRSVGR